jgi:radical SAM superfamily enzyme YgiQ (UPF0313 family)
LNYFKSFFKKNKIEVVISGLGLPTISEDVEFARFVKREFRRVKFVFKTGISYKQILEKVIVDSGAWLIIFGECDLTIGEYLSGKRKSGSVYFDRGKLVVSPVTLADRVMNLDDLPVSAREKTKFKLYKYGLLPGVVTTMQTSRGCPYPCGFYCPYPLVQGKAWRAMGNDRVIKELKSIINLGIRSVLFRDATLLWIIKELLNYAN